MSLFKKKDRESKTFSTLKILYEHAKNYNENHFYYVLDNREEKIAERFCKQYHLTYSIDHITDGKLIYKFSLLKT